MMPSLARTAPLAAALSALALGCGGAPGPRAPAQPATVAIAAAPKAPAAAPAEAAPEPRPEVLVTEDELVRAPRPSGPGWECHVEQLGAARIGMRASYVQCLKETAQGVISLMAKDYEVPRAAATSAEKLSRVDYPRHYRKRWDHVKYTSSAAVDHHGYPAWEAVIELSRDSGARLHMVERVAVVGTHTLNLSADAPPAMFPAFERDVKRWFDGVEFGALRVDPRFLAGAPGGAGAPASAAGGAGALAAAFDAGRAAGAPPGFRGWRAP